jgi:S-adenosylmethionine:tRNA ribosyltransferase-isomerase
MVIRFPGGVCCQIVGRCEGECWRVAFSGVDDFSSWLDRFGSVPLPPYIRREPSGRDRERYQTIFAASSGAVAAPTAGLHVTTDLLDRLRSQGISVAAITLHVGLGTFMPVRSDDLSEHRMHREQFVVPEATARLVHETRQNGGRIVALGTTTTRALEHAADDTGQLRAGEGEADIFIVPGYRFKIIDALITNFHLPKSTLLMLVSAFAGKELLFRAYREAVEKQFRFYSYGDAMFIQ